jgi:hypothetical protein
LYLAGKPNDNPVNEALNGWIKEEIIIDFKAENSRLEIDFIIQREGKYDLRPIVRRIIDKKIISGH